VLYRNAYETLAQNIPQVLSVTNPLSLPIPTTSLSTSSRESEPPADQSQFPCVKFWHKRDWTTFQKDTKGLSKPYRKAVTVRGKVRASQGENVTMLFVENEGGDVIDGDRASEIRRVARSIWVQLASAGKAPRSWGKADIVTAEHYKREMRLRFPELRLCALDWKAEQIAIENYPSWHQHYFKDTIKHEESDTNISDAVPRSTKRPQSDLVQPINHSTKKKQKMGSMPPVAGPSEDISANADLTSKNMDDTTSGSEPEDRRGQAPTLKVHSHCPA
jgi:hypothetical protein